jgi:hypothetical protein
MITIIIDVVVHLWLSSLGNERMLLGDLMILLY